MSLHPKRVGRKGTWVRVTRKRVMELPDSYKWQYSFHILGGNNKTMASAHQLDSRRAVSQAILAINPNLPVVFVWEKRRK